jgi:hypothetical protein
MNKIKYPDRTEVDRQISIIIDKAGIFNEIEEQPNYTECVKVKSAKPYIQRIAFLAGVAVVIAAIMGTLKFSRISSATSSEPMTNVIENDTINKQTGIRINNQITVAFSNQGGYMTFDTPDETLTKGQNVYSIPVVYYRGEEVAAISSFYNDRISEMQSKIDIKFSYIDTGVGKNTQRNVNDLPIYTKYNCSTVTGISLNNTDVVTIFENYSETSKYNNTVTAMNEIYGNNFDASSGERIKLGSIFRDENAGMQELANQLQQQLKEAHASDSLANSYQDTASVMQYLTDGNWYFGADGITVCCNNIRQENSQYSDVTYLNDCSETYVIPYGGLTYLKSEFSK